MNNLVGLVIAVVVTLFFVRRYLKEQELREVARPRSREKGNAAFGWAPVPASAYRHAILHRLRDLHDGLPGRRRARHAWGTGGHRQRLQVHRAQPVRGGLPGRRHHDGHGQSEHGRGPASTDARI